MVSRDARTEELRSIIAKQAAQIERVTRRVAELELELAKAKKDSSTSSKPPSSDIVKPPPKKQPGKRKKRKRGGQPGHQRQLREPLPPERVNETIDYEIDDTEVQRLRLAPTGDYGVVQHIELPEAPVHVTEHRLAVYEDTDGNVYLPDCPELSGPILGPRMLVTIDWLKSVGHCSYSTIETAARQPRVTESLGIDACALRSRACRIGRSVSREADSRSVTSIVPARFGQAPPGGEQRESGDSGR